MPLKAYTDYAAMVADVSVDEDGELTVHQVDVAVDCGPVVNPDGYVYNEVNDPFGGGLWRKNRRNNGGGSFGVDLNRNWTVGFGGRGSSSRTRSSTPRPPWRRNAAPGRPSSSRA